MLHRYIVILAGGSGTRFWPMSRERCPKQFLKIIDDKSFLQHTVLRILSVVPVRNILIVTNKDFLSEVIKQLKGYRISRITFY